jgi:hypothetical protein
VKRGAPIHGASILDVAPTVLHLFGLPRGADMDGQVLINAFVDNRVPEAVPSWDATPGSDGCHPPSRQYDGVSAAESMKQLVALGYVAPPGEDRSRAVAETVIENKYNLARSPTWLLPCCAPWWPRTPRTCASTSICSTAICSRATAQERHKC